MKISNALVSVGGAFVLGTGLGWSINGEHTGYLFSSYIPALAALLSGYYGAKFAVEFQSKKEEKERRRREVVSGNMAIFKFVEMLNSLLSYQRQVIDPVRGT